MRNNTFDTMTYYKIKTITYNQDYCRQHFKKPNDRQQAINSMKYNTVKIIEDNKRIHSNDRQHKKCINRQQQKMKNS